MYPTIPSAPISELNDTIKQYINDEIDKRLPKINEKIPLIIDFTVNIDDQILNLQSGSFGVLNILENNKHYAISLFKINACIETIKTNTILNINSIYKYIKKNNIKSSRVGFLVKEYFSYKYNTNIKKITFFDVLTTKKILMSINIPMSIPNKIISHEGKKNHYIRVKNGIYIKYNPIDRKHIKKIL